MRCRRLPGWWARLAITATLATLVPGRVTAQTGGTLDAAIRLFDARRYDDAKPLLASYAAEHRDDSIASHYLGRIAMVEGDFEGAARFFERALTLDDRNAASHFWLGRALGLQAVRGSKLRAMGLAKRSGRELERAVALDPDNVEARLALVQFYLVAPRLVGGNEGKARAQVAEIARRNAFRGHVARAWVAEDARDYRAAEQAYHDATSAYPDSATAFYYLGLLYQREEQYDKAFAVFEQLAGAHPEEPSALYALGRLGALTGQRLDRAEAALQQYLATPLREGDPPLASAHFRLGAIYERTGRRALARQEYEASLRLERRPEVEQALARVR